MKVYISQYSGFCVGVERAIKIAREYTKKYKNIYIIEDVVHNQQVSEELRRWGVKKVKKIEEIPQGKFFLINAHGVGKETYQKAKRRNLKIIDTTCPIVKNIHKEVINLEREGYSVVIIGDKNHAETKGILKNTKRGIVIENVENLRRIKKRIPPKIGCVSQSTQAIENVVSVVCELIKIAQEIKFIKTICREIEKRQQEIKKLSKKVEAVIIVGSRESANTNRLFNIARSINPYTFFVERPQEIKNEWKKFKSIGVAGGTSTPFSLLKKTKEKLNDL